MSRRRVEAGLPSSCSSFVLVLEFHDYSSTKEEDEGRVRSGQGCIKLDSGRPKAAWKRLVFGRKLVAGVGFEPTAFRL